MKTTIHSTSLKKVGTWLRTKECQPPGRNVQFVWGMSIFGVVLPCLGRRPCGRSMTDGECFMKLILNRKWA